jgi:hypothetical protein
MDSAPGILAKCKHSLLVLVAAHQEARRDRISVLSHGTLGVLSSFMKNFETLDTVGQRSWSQTGCPLS